MTAYKGLGTYGNAVGVVTPLDHKGAQAGQVVKATATTIRAGLFWPGTGTIISGTAGMSYNVIAYNCVTQRSASAGAVFGGNDGVLNVVTTAAPGSNSRIDVLYHWHREFSLDGVDSTPVIGVVQGTAAAVPVAPSLSAFPGAIEIGRATVGAGITATTSATITQTALFTAMAGGLVPFRTTTERDAGTYLESQLGWLVDSDTIQVYTGATWVGLGNRINPTSATNGSVATDGSVTSTAQSLVRVRDAFPSGFRVFRVIFDVTTSAATALNLRLAVDATDSITGYDVIYVASIPASTPAPAQLLNQSEYLVTAINLAARHVGEVLFYDPNQVADTRILSDGLTSNNPMTTSSGKSSNSGVHRPLTAYNSLTFRAASGTVTVNRVTVEGVS